MHKADKKGGVREVTVYLTAYPTILAEVTINPAIFTVRAGPAPSPPTPTPLPGTQSHNERSWKKKGGVRGLLLQFVKPFITSGSLFTPQLTPQY
jgi:hypothetical protein